MDNLKLSKIIGMAVGYIFVISIFWIDYYDYTIGTKNSIFYNFIDMFLDGPLYTPDIPAILWGIISLLLPWRFREELGKIVRKFFEIVQNIYNKI